MKVTTTAMDICIVDIDTVRKYNKSQATPIYVVKPLLFWFLAIRVKGDRNSVMDVWYREYTLA